MSKKFIGENLTGKTFGKWHVLEFIPNDKPHSFWKIKCLECNIERTIPKSNITNSNNFYKCINCKNATSLIGKKFNYLTVIEDSKERTSYGGVLWNCKCICGKIVKHTGKILQQEEVKSCGCKRYEDLTNQVFGFLTVLELTNKRIKDKYRVWKCLCECNSLCEVQTYMLTSGKTISCGNCSSSKGETKIKSLLNQNLIEYISQKWFEDLKSENNRPLKFDFEVKYEDKIHLLEFDGQQHFKYSGSGWDSKETFERTRKHDLLKTEYCLKNKIDLIRIPYWELDKFNINDLIPSTSLFLVKDMQQLHEYFKQGKLK